MSGRTRTARLKIGVSAGIQLIGALDFYAALAEKIHNHSMQNRGAHLCFDIVADDWEVFLRESFCPNRIARDENRNVIDEREAGLQGATGIETGRFLGTDREIIHHDFGRGIFQLGHDLFASRFFFQWQECAERILFGHVGRIAVEHATHLHDCAGEVDLFAKNFRAIGRREYGLAHIEPDFAPVNIKRGHDFDIARTIRADLPVHQSDAGAVGRRAVIKIYSLDERTGAISHSDDGDSYFSHLKKRYPSRSRAVRARYKLLCRF